MIPSNHSLKKFKKIKKIQMTTVDQPPKKLMTIEKKSVKKCFKNLRGKKHNFPSCFPNW